jgi:hypothetical protein
MKTSDWNQKITVRDLFVLMWKTCGAGFLFALCWLPLVWFIWWGMHH